MRAGSLTYSEGLTPFGRWQMVDAPVQGRYRNLVHGARGFRERSSAPIRREELPGPSTVVILSFGEPYRLSPRDSLAPAIHPQLGFVAALNESVTVDEIVGEAECIQLDLTPIGLRQLLGIPLHHLANQVIPIEDVLGRSGRMLVESIADAATWEVRFELLERYLDQRFARTAPPREEVTWAWERLISSGGRVPVAEVANGIGVSGKHLLSLFQDQIGLSPKRTARLIRFQRMLARARGEPGLSWARIAAECGYADQSHLVREVRVFTGRTPGELRSLLAPDATQPADASTAN